MKGKYIKPSELLKLQQETGKSYWDLIGRPLGKKPKDPAKDVVDEYDPVQREALRMQIEDYHIRSLQVSLQSLIMSWQEKSQREKKDVSK